MSETELIEYQRQLLVALVSLERQVLETKAKLLAISVIIGADK